MGVILSSLGLTALTYGFIVTSTDGWASIQVAVALTLAVVLLAAFIAWDGRRSNPFLDLTLFKNRTFSSALGAVTAVFFVMFGVSYLVSQYIQFVQGADPFEVGIRFIPSAAATILGSNLAARLAERFGLRTIMLVGMVLVTGGLITLTTLSVASGVLPVTVAFVLVGFGMGLVIAPASNAIVGTLPPDKIGAGSGLRATVQLLGGSFGVAIVGSLAAGVYRSSIQKAFDGPLRHVPAASRPAIQSQIGDALGRAATFPHDLASCHQGGGEPGLRAGLASLRPRRSGGHVYRLTDNRHLRAITRDADR